MTPITIIMLTFSLLGIIDLIIGNKFGLGEQFERGIMLLGPMAMSMIGMLVLAPLIAHVLQPAVGWITTIIPMEPSVIPSMFLANDMGGAPLAMEFASNDEIGYFNGLIVAAMMGATVSFTLPFALGVVKKEQHESLLLGLLCGIVMVPIGCLATGLIMTLPIKDLLATIIPLFLFAGILAVGLFMFPYACLKVFKVFGAGIKILILIGFGIGIFEALTGLDLVPYTAPISEGFNICANAAMVLSGAFPLVYILSKVLEKPMKAVSTKLGINSTSALGLLSTLATCVTAFSNMKEMDEKGAMLNSAFSVSAAFVFGGHLAFTLSFNAEYVVGMIIGKLIAGFGALFVAALLYKFLLAKKQKGGSSTQVEAEG